MAVGAAQRGHNGRVQRAYRGIRCRAAGEKGMPYTLADAAPVRGGTMTTATAERAAARPASARRPPHASAKLTPVEVLHVCALLRHGFRQGQVARMHGIAQSTISQITRGITWRWLTGLSPDSPIRPRARRGSKPAPQPRHAHLTPDQVRQVLDWHYQGVSGREIARRIRRSAPLVSMIVNGDRWRKITGIEPAIPGTKARDSFK